MCTRTRWYTTNTYIYMFANPNIRIAFALLLASVLIAGALLIKDAQLRKTAGQQDAVAVVTNVPERQPIETRDKNQDGVPDWQEALLVTNALDLASTSAGYQQPDTLTEQFALEFFQDMVRSKNYGAFGSTPDEIALSASEALAQRAQDVLITSNDINISADNSPEALSAYGEAVAKIIATYSQPDTINEAIILEKALQTQEESELNKLDTIISVYKNYLNETKELYVPSSQIKNHLALLNSYQAILTDIEAMRVAFTDPMYTLIRLKRYQDDASGLYVAIINLYNSLIMEGAQWNNNSPVFSLITFNTNTFTNE